MTVRQAAGVLGLDVQTVRLLLQSGKLPWGVAIKSDGRLHYTYVIYEQKFAELTGYKMEGGENNG